MNIRLFFTIVFFLLSLFISVSSKASTSALLLAEGCWELIPAEGPRDDGWDKTHRCSVEPLNVKIDVEAKRYTARFGSHEELIKADILSSGDNFLQLKYDNEKRKMKNGDIQIWNMFFVSEDEFYWVREDWIENEKILNSTQGRRRCMAPIA